MFLIAKPKKVQTLVLGFLKKLANKTLKLLMPLKPDFLLNYDSLPNV